MLSQLANAGYQVADLLPAFPGESLSDIQQRYVDTELATRRVVERFGYLSTRPCQSRYLNVNRLRQRVVPLAHEPSQSLDHLRIGLFGSSTVFGAGISDEETIAAQLSSSLNSSGSRYRFEVLNFAAMNHTSQHSSLRFADETLFRGRLDYAVFLEGWNDCRHASGSGDGILPFLDGVLESFQRDSDVSIDVGYLRSLLKSNSYGGSAQDLTVKSLTEELEFLKRRLSLAYAMRTAIGKCFDTTIRNYWEPSIYLDLRPEQNIAPRLLLQNRRSEAIAFHMKAEGDGELSELFEGFGVASLSRMGKSSIPECLYLDCIHPSPFLAKLLAERLATDILQSLA